MANPILVFDAYGTLFDVHAAARAHRDEIGPNWERLTQLWRQKHLEYTWIYAQTGRRASFRLLTERSLDYAIGTIGGISPKARDLLINSYWRMATFPEVHAFLSRQKQQGKRLAILSNGDVDMLQPLVSAAGLVDTFEAVISVEAAGTFKPAMRVYQLVHDRLGGSPSDVSFFSQNRWDIAGAKAFGFTTVWVNRLAAPEEYPDMPADRTVSALDQWSA